MLVLLEDDAVLVLENDEEARCELKQEGKEKESYASANLCVQICRGREILLRGGDQDGRRGSSIRSELGCRT